MIKKILLIFVLIFIYGCNGYNPIYSQKNQGFKIENIYFQGDIKLGKEIGRNINNIEKQNLNAVKKLDLYIQTKLEKSIKSKYTRGNPNKFQIKIVVDLNTKIDDEKSLEKRFSYSNIYNALSSEFEQNKFEKTLEKTLVSKISEKIIIYLQTI